MKNVEALKKLYGAINLGSTGAVVNDNTIAEVVDHLANLMGGVMEYIGEKITPFVITVTATSETAGASDVTASEILNAFTEGRTLIVKVNFSGIDYQFSPVAVAVLEESISVVAIGITQPSGVLMELSLEDSTGTSNAWQVHSYVLTPVE